MNTWESLSAEHHEILSKIQVLEEALIDLLRERATGVTLGKALKLQKGFLELFKVGAMQHFMIEEEALFPMFRGGGKRS